MDPRGAYGDLIARSRAWSTLNSCASLLSWDEQTLMPSGGAPFRGEQHAILAGIAHERATDPAVGELLNILENSELLDDPETPEAVNVRQLRRDYDRKVTLPRLLVEELARVTSVAQHEWVQARRDCDYRRFQPWLERIVALKRQEAACHDPEGDPYTASWRITSRGRPPRISTSSSASFGPRWPP